MNVLFKWDPYTELVKAAGFYWCQHCIHHGTTFGVFQNRAGNQEVHSSALSTNPSITTTLC